MLLAVDEDRLMKPKPKKVIGWCMKKVKNQALVEVLVCQQGQGDDKATWEAYLR